MSPDALKVSTNALLPPKGPLESLRSPQETTEVSAAESIVESDFNEIALDDDGAFSPVALTSHRTSGSAGFLDRDAPEEHSQLFQQPVFNPSKQFSHKKSASTTTIHSSNNLPFLLARLDLQEESSVPHRSSMDGQQKLQEEFARLYREEEEADQGAIDWGAWPEHYVTY